MTSSSPEMLKQFFARYAGVLPIDAVDLEDENPERFSRWMKFGTAGLRGLMGYGTNCMNSVTVRYASQAIYVHYFELIRQRSSGPVCVGYDARHNSLDFAYLVAGVFASKGVQVIMNRDKVTPTPLTPFAVVKYGCVCGIQITASHNHRADNGMKVYNSSGAQITRAEAQSIFSLMEDGRSIAEIWNIELDKNRVEFVDYSIEIWDSYKSRMKEELNIQPFDQVCAYTPVHGVGWWYVHDFLVNDLKCQSPLVPENQREPNPEFPTSEFPNPEEDQPLEEVMKLARENEQIQLVLANDPDADRLAVVEKQKDGKFIKFSGDEIGLIFFEILFEASHTRDKRAFFTTFVSSSYMKSLCGKRKVPCYITHTGFGNLMEKVAELGDAVDPIFLYEEAIGFCLAPQLVPDKDGISAACLLLQQASRLYKSGSTLYEFYQEIGRKSGLRYQTNNVFKKIPKPLDSLEKIRTSNYRTPPELAASLVRILDGKTGYDSLEGKTEDSIREILFPATDMIALYLNDESRFILRASGTEPKLKLYSEVKYNPRNPGEEAKAIDRLRSTIDLLSKIGFFG